MTLQYVCTACGRRTPVTTRRPCCECSGLFELDAQIPAWDEALIDRSEWSLFRYRRFMALEGDSWRDVTLGEGMTPVISFAPGILFKMDYFMPSLSFKDGMK